MHFAVLVCFAYIWISGSFNTHHPFGLVPQVQDSAKLQQLHVCQLQATCRPGFSLLGVRRGAGVGVCQQAGPHWSGHGATSV